MGWKMRKMGSSGENSRKPVNTIGVNLDGIALSNPVILAPMAGVTDYPFRKIAAEFEPGLMCGEMVSAKGLLYENKKTSNMIAHHNQGIPYSQQLFGSSPKIMAKAAKKLEQMGVDVIDINMGCPAPKIVGNGEGAALLRTPGLALEIVRQVTENVQLPVTVKLRKGFNRGAEDAGELAIKLQEEKITALVIHGRTREDYYSGRVDWDFIKTLASELKIPVIGNGDLFSPKAASIALKKTGCVGVMIGRGTMGNPWLLKRTREYLETGKILSQPGVSGIRDTLKKHYNEALEYYGVEQGVKIMRKQLTWYLRGMPHNSKVKNKVLGQEDPEKVWGILNNFFSWLEE